MVLTHLVRKTKAVAGKLHESHDYITNVISPYTWWMA